MSQYSHALSNDYIANLLFPYDYSQDHCHNKVEHTIFYA